MKVIKSEVGGYDVYYEVLEEYHDDKVVVNTILMSDPPKRFKRSEIPWFEFKELTCFGIQGGPALSEYVRINSSLEY